MTLATYISPTISIPIALVCTCVLLWYWHRLGGESYAQSTRRIRRTSIATMMIALFFLVYATGFTNKNSAPHAYTAAWVLAITIVLAVVFLAFLDAINNMRLHRKDRESMLVETHSRLIKAAKSSQIHRAEEESANNKEVTS